jgi:Terminase large subunit, T4likevirus-type, N-terminal
MGRWIRDGKCHQDIIYDPLPSQARFHGSDARFKGFSGPVGSGKSQALCQEALKLSYLNPGRMGMIGAPTYTMLRDVTQRAFLEILTDSGIPYELNKGESTLVLKDTRSKILLRSLDDYERLRGTNLAWFAIDELTYTQLEAWLRLEARLRDPKAHRLCGFGVWTPKGHDWVYERFLGDPVKGYEVVIAKPEENVHLLEKVPDFYERLRHSYDEKFFRQEVLGEYLNIAGGRAYASFDRQANVGETKVDPLRPLLWALDFNVDPMCSVIAQVDAGRIKVLDEIVLSRASTSDACEEFLGRYGNHLGGVVIYGDASGHHMQTTSGISDYETIDKCFRSAGQPIPTSRTPNSNPTVRHRLCLVNAKLRTAAGETELVVNGRCKELIKDLEEVTLQEGTFTIDKGRDPKRTHLSDALGYLIWQECGKQVSFGEQSKPLG